MAPNVAMDDVHSASSRCIQQRALLRFFIVMQNGSTVEGALESMFPRGLPVDLLCMLLQTIALLSHWEHWNDFNLGPVFHSLVIL